MKKTENNPDPNRLRVLILEDNPVDAELVAHELHRAEIIFASRVVDKENEFSKALSEFHPQVILSDFKLPLFDGLAALEIARVRMPEIPFIFVSGSIGEEKAIELLSQGASDYIFKDNLQRLGPAVKRTVEAARLKLEKENSDEELRRRADELQLLAEAADRFVHINDLDEVYAYLAQTIPAISGADYLLLSLYDEKLRAVRPKIVVGFEPFRETIRRRFNIDLLQIVFYFKDMRPDDFSDFVSRKLLPVRDGLFGLANRNIPRASCRLIEKLLAIGTMHTMGFSWENQLYGSVTVVFKKGKTLQNQALVETLLNQATVSIKRLLAEKSLRESDEQLRQSEEYYRTLVETSPDAIIIVDAGGRVTFASHKTHEVFGFPVQTTIIGVSIMDFVEPGEIPRVQGRMVEILSGRSLPQINEYRLLKHDRRPFWGEISSSPLQDAAGRSIGLLLVCRDVTERNRAEMERQALLKVIQGQLASENLHDFLRKAHASISKVIYAENFFVALYNKDTAMFEEVYSVDKFDPPAHPSKLEKSISGYVFRTGQPLLLTQERFDELAAQDEMKLVGTNSPSWLGVPLKTSRETIGVMVVQDYEKINRYSGHELDFLVSIAGQVALMIERKRVEELLVERDQLLKNLSAQVPGMVYTFRRRPDGTYCIPFTSNAVQGIFGVSPQEVIDDASAIFKVIFPEDQPRVVAAIEDSARTLSPWQTEYRVQLPGKPFRWILGQSDPVRLADGSVLWYGVNTDISERKQSEELICASLKEKEVLLQEIHHRVKNNLQIISGLLTLQADQSAGKTLDEVFRASQNRIRSIALVHEKLYRSRNLAEIAFDEYLRTLTENLFISQGIVAGRITVTYEMEPIYFSIEKAIPLGLIVNELLTNALKHAFPAGQQGEIRIALHGYKEAKSYALKTDSGTLHIVPTCELIVADDGIGLPAGFKADTQKSLGMHLVSMLARQIQAELKVKTGPGAEFRLVFSGQPANAVGKDKDHGG